MNTPNPLLPQGSLAEKSKGKSHIRIAVITILAIHVVLLGALLIQGCKPEPTPDPKPTFDPSTNVVNEPTPTNPVPNITPTNPPVPPTNAYVPPTNNIPVPPSGDATVHTVAKNDSFYSLGKKYGVTMKAVELANPGVDSSKLKIGQKLNIPAKAAPPLAPAPGANNPVPPAADAEGTYTVKAGDNLGKIAAAHHTTVKALMAANNLKTTAIKATQKLKIPAKTAPAPAPVAVP